MPTEFPPTNCNPHPSRSSNGARDDEVSVNPALLLNRLVNVKSTGDQQWRACCPVHESKGRSSLSIRQVEDGRLLIHCHGGCEPLEILKICGLELTDLFPERIAHHAAPVECRIWRQAATMRDWQGARNTIQAGKLNALEPRTTTMATITPRSKQKALTKRARELK